VEFRTSFAYHDAGELFPMSTKYSFAISFLFVTLMVCPAPRAQDNRFVVFEGGKHGYINQEGELVIPITLEGTYVLNFSEERAKFAEPVKPVPARIPYLDKNGKLRISQEVKWGFIDMSGAVVVAPQFDAAGDFHEGLAPVAFDTDRTSHNCSDCDLNQRWGFIDKQGKMVIQPHYHAVRPFSEGPAAVEDDDGKWGYINTKGDVVIPLRLDMARGFHEGVAAAAINKLAGYIDKQGSFVVKPQFTVVGDFSGGLAAVRVGGKMGLMILGPAGGKWAFIRKNGSKRIRLPKDTENAHDFSEGLAAIEVDGHCGYIDTAGAIAIPVEFSLCGDFSEGMADVGKDKFFLTRLTVASTLSRMGWLPWRKALLDRPRNSGISTRTVVKSGNLGLPYSGRLTPPGGMSSDLRCLAALLTARRSDKLRSRPVA
jgi:hypothetical protein